MSESSPAEPNNAPVTATYGIDAPGVVFALGAVGVACVFAGLFFAAGKGPSAAIGPWFSSVFWFGAAGYMVWSSRTGKRRLWQQVLDAANLQGTERVIDIGCGRGMVTNEIASRLDKGSVVGVDIWRNRDQSGNTQEQAQRNAQAEGVDDRVEIQRADMRELSSPDDSFDLAVASLAIHNLPLAAERGEAMKEMMRVVRPGGRIIIIDMFKTIEYIAWLTDAGWNDVERSSRRWGTYPPSRVVTATRPLRGAKKG